MGKVISALEAAAVYDPATGTTVQVNLISPDETEITRPPISNNTSTGVTFGGFNFSGVIGFFEGDGLAQLGEWQDDGLGKATRVNLAAAGEGEFILMNEPEKLTVERGVGVDARDGANVNILTIQNVGYNPDVYQQVNLVEAGAGAFDLFNDSAALTYSFLFPVEGVTISAGADYANYSTDDTITITFLDFAGSTLSSDTTTVDGNGRFQVSAQAPANTYKVSIEFASSGNFSGGDVTDRAIRLGSNAGYVAN